MVSIIAAVGKNRELGKNNKLLWSIPLDMKRFRELTTGNSVIMGRKTYESLPPKFRPLPKRFNFVVTRDSHYQAPGAVVCTSIEEAIKAANNTGKEVFIIGGAQVYAQSLAYADKLYLTLVEKSFPEADAFFPDYSAFKTEVFEEFHNDNDPPFIFTEFVK